jgi:hypothetical protein
VHDVNNLKASSQSNRVTLVGIRTEVSRHFKEIIALGFGMCRLGCPTAPGDLKGMINKFNIALGQTQWCLHGCLSVAHTANVPTTCNIHERMWTYQIQYSGVYTLITIYYVIVITKKDP